MDYNLLIQTLGYIPKENSSGIFYKKYNEDYSIEIDFEKQKIDFGNKIKSESRTTQNFSQPENWVVLECVDRLLEKGYRPEDITLEKTFKVGHGASGGRLDIFVEKEGKAFLMIECKTYGKEYEKEFKKLEKNGGQLFTYFQNDTNAEYLMLYASTLVEDSVKIQQSIVKIEEHYRDAGNIVDVFERWNKITLENGIFEDWVKPYVFENKRITKNDLIPLDEEVSTSLFHNFLTILRKHSVSDKPNAFNVIFDLFLAKLWDEKKENDEEMDFQWRENDDDPVSFQYRLLDLYRVGMNDFLKKEVFALKDSDFGNINSEKLQNIKRKVLMLEKAFNIKSVIDEESFEANHRVLKEIVQLLQQYQIRYPRKQQHLSDFFEHLLTTGLKQEAGQFFTPPPITRFIVKSLPVKDMLIESINQKTPELPAVIDYAVGSGHFLTEMMEEYQTIINDLDISDFKTDAKKKVQKWRIDEYDWASEYIYGIDKDYRLVKVAKVGCYFYGDGVAQVVHGDGLDNFELSTSYRGLLKENAKKPQFKFVLSNPPYSVSAFKTTLKGASAEKDFELFNKLTDRSSEIECLFIERTKQLLKTDGIASIILPSSILNNKGIYTRAREIILKSFDIVAITELGSNTFMATGTNTVVLFLKRRADEIISKIENSLSIFFENLKDITIYGIENAISKYITYVWEDISFEDYITLLQQNPNENIKEHDIFKEYNKKISKDKWNSIIATEREKLCYFILAYNQQLVLVKTGHKKEEKQFLGYEFSDKRGKEGMHPIQRGKTVDECTKLYNVNDLTDENKASSYIYKAFTENNFDAEIPENLKQNISYQNLVDMLTYDRVDFEKNISLSAKKKVRIESKWEQVKLGDVSSIIRGVTYSKSDQTEEETSKIILPSDNITLKGKLEINKKVFLYDGYAVSDDKKLKINDIFICFSSGSKQHLGKVAFISEESNYYAGGFMGIIRVKENIKSKYVYSLLNSLLRQSIRDIGSGSNINNLSSVVNDIKIPLPPLEIQEKIVSEIEVLEKQEEKAIEEVESLKKSVFSMFNTYEEGKISDICQVSKLKLNPQENKEKQYIYLGLEHIESNTGKVLSINKETGSNIMSTKNVFKKGDVLYGKLRPYLNKVFLTDFDGICSTDILVLNTEYPFLLKYILLSDDFVSKAEKMMKGVSLPRIGVKDFLNIKIPLPPIEEQQKIVAKIEKIEQQIAVLESQIAEMPTKREAILKKYL